MLEALSSWPGHEIKRAAPFPSAYMLSKSLSSLEPALGETSHCDEHQQGLKDEVSDHRHQETLVADLKYN